MDSLVTFIFLTSSLLIHLSKIILSWPYDTDLSENEMKDNIHSHTQIYGNKRNDTVNSYSIK